MPDSPSTYICTACRLTKRACDFYKSMKVGKEPLLCHPCRKQAIKQARKRKRLLQKAQRKGDTRRNRLIRNATPSEQHLMAALELVWRGKTIPWQFQYPVGPFFADFAINRAKIIIEIDGGYHLDPMQRTYDERRTMYLEERGWTVIRFTNDQVIHNVIEVVRQISARIGLTV